MVMFCSSRPFKNYSLELSIFYLSQRMSTTSTTPPEDCPLAVGCQKLDVHFSEAHSKDGRILSCSFSLDNAHLGRRNLIEQCSKSSYEFRAATLDMLFLPTAHAQTPYFPLHFGSLFPYIPLQISDFTYIFIYVTTVFVQNFNDL